MEWPSSYLDEYEKLIMRLSPPRARVDNVGSDNATRVMIDSVRKHGTLLEAIQILTDLDLTIKKAYISSDGQWFMAVFHVTDLDGNKLTDKRVINYIEQSLSKIQYAGFKSIEGLTTLELTGTDRVGLLAEVFEVLSDLQVNVVESKVWTHNGRIASLVYVKDCDSGFPIQDEAKIDMIETQLRNVLKGDTDIRSVKTLVSLKVTHTERRLHQMIEDRARLLFDVVCTLTDMDYAVFHANLKTKGERAHMEFFVRHKNGLPISSQAEKQFVSLCLHAAIERRASEGVRLELCAQDRPGLLAKVMRTFREYSLNVARAEISTTCDIARNSFYVTDAVGNAADTKMIESVRQKIGLSKLRVKELPSIYHYKAERKDDPPSTIISGAFLTSLGNLVTRNSRGAFLISIGNLVTRNLRYLGLLIRSYSGTIKRKIVLV
ncbi:ACT domain-containing protein ACR8 [Heracleum sosnowskyi]|uniref:ACT domain-containing protein ACR n=1 Tax=Heracleum sosnowskyi TaxID=360622 RepID=A0AAD8HIN1_9APIA|nr:ACT domain-containing protein ACR8 [Heracleum sosnowskyi]